MLPSEIPSQQPSSLTTCRVVSEPFETGVTVPNVHGDEPSQQATCEASFSYAPYTDTGGALFDVYDLGLITPVLSEDTCVTIQYKGGPDSCGSNAVYLGYLDTYDPNDQATNFLGYGDVFYAESLSFSIPAGSALRLVAQSFYVTGNSDIAGGCLINWDVAWPGC